MSVDLASGVVGGEPGGAPGYRRVNVGVGAIAGRPVTGGYRRALVTGGSGRLGQAVVPELERRGWMVVAPGRGALDITDADAVRAAVLDLRPEAVVNLAAWTDLERCEIDEDAAHAVNAEAVHHLARAAAMVGARLCQVSTDYVFDGEKGAPYLEDDAVGPLSAYGRTKWAGEVAAGPEALVIRTAWLAAPTGPSFVAAVLAALDQPDRVFHHDDEQRSSPTSVVDLALVLGELVGDGATGVVHVTNAGSATRHEVVRHLLAGAGCDPTRAAALPATPHGLRAGVRRPRSSVLDGARLRAEGRPALRPWQEALAELVIDSRRVGR